MRIKSLDMLRGVAVLMVFMVHVPKPAQFEKLASIGTYGVDLFFVLSGFLISSILFAELDQTGTIDLKRFWLRRGLKIWPSYFVAYAVYFVLLIALDVKSGSSIGRELRHAVPNVFFFQNYFAPVVEWPHSWSIAVEEHFYIALPLLLLLAHQPRKLLIASACICLGVLILRSRAVGHVPVFAIHRQTQFRADSLTAGVMLGCLFRYYPERMSAFKGRAWLAPMFLGLGIFVGAIMRSDGLPLTLVYLCFAIVVSAAVSNPDGLQNVFGRWLAKVGEYSYTLYLSQAAAIALCLPMRTVWLRAATFSLVTVSGGILLSRFVERPALRFRERWCAKEPRTQFGTLRPVTNKGMFV